jgi:hypothetical protein
VIAVALAPGADRTESCSQAAERYNRIKAEVEAAVQVFAACLANSRGRDACVAEFDELDAAEARLEAVVGEHQEACP